MPENLSGKGVQLGAVVAKQPKKNSGKKPESPPQEEDSDGKFTKMARLRPEFQLRLARVAKDAGMKVGEFIELYLGETVNREYKRIVLEEAARVRGEE